MRRETLCLGFAAAASIACSGVTDPVDRLRVEVAIDRAEVVVGETAGVTVRVVNPTADTVTLTGLRSCVVRFAVVDAVGRDRTSRVCVDMFERRQIAPGDTLVDNLKWGAWVADPAGGGTLAEPGLYGIRGEVDAHEGYRTTRPVPIRVLAAPQP